MKLPVVAESCRSAQHAGGTRAKLKSFYVHEDMEETVTNWLLRSTIWRCSLLDPERLVQTWTNQMYLEREAIYNELSNNPCLYARYCSEGNTYLVIHVDDIFIS